MKYRVEGGVAEIGADMVLKLTKEQASARAHALEEVKDVKGGLRPTSIVQFKSGEEIEIVSPAQHDALPRNLAVVLVPLDKKKTAPKADLAKLEKAVADARTAHGAAQTAETQTALDAAEAALAAAKG